MELFDLRKIVLDLNIQAMLVCYLLASNFGTSVSGAPEEGVVKTSQGPITEESLVPLYELMGCLHITVYNKVDI